MLVLTFILTACSTNQTSEMNATNDRLSPCPESPNCVSSLSGDKSHYVEPLRYKATLEEAREKLISIINAMKRTEIVDEVWYQLPLWPLGEIAYPLVAAQLKRIFRFRKQAIWEALPGER